MKLFRHKTALASLLLTLATGVAAQQTGVTVRGGSVTEGNSGTTPLRFTVERNGSLAQEARVTVSTNANSLNPATENTDYVPLPETVVRLPANVATATVDVPVKGDTVTEANETFLLHATRAVTPTGLDFLAASSFRTGLDPRSVAIADVDGDQRPDLVTANVFSDTVSVLLNTGASGAGRFAAAQSFTVGIGPASVAVADLDADGRPDLAVANALGDSVSVLRNLGGSGAGQFAAAQSFAVGDGPVSVAIADVDGDQRPDLVTANEFSDNVSVLLNTGASGADRFAAAQSFAVGARLSSLAIADVDGDQRSDLVTAGNNSVSVLFNTGAAGAGRFAAVQSFAVGFERVLAVAVADLDADGRPDLVTTEGGRIVVLRNTGASGAGRFASAQSFATGTQPNSVAVADLDADRHPDLVVTNQTSTIESDGVLISGPGVVSVLLSRPDTPLPILTNEAVGTIVDDDAPAFTASIADVRQAEGNGSNNLSFTVTLSAARNQTTALSYRTTDGSATVADADYTAANGTLSIPAGQTRGSFTLVVRGDAKVESDESFTVTLSNPPAGVGFSKASAQATLVNDDSTPPIAFMLRASDSAAEAAGRIAVSVRLSAATNRDVSIPFTVSGTTLAADRQMLTASPLVIRAGATSGEIAYTLQNDALDEATETVILTLGTPTGATRDTAKSTHTLSITDDDATPTVSIGNASLAEGNSGTRLLGILVTLSAPSGQVITVRYSTHPNGAAQAGTDYDVVSNASVTLAPGETSKTLPVTLRGDTVVEPNETFGVKLGGATNATLATNTALGTVLNDD